MASPWGLLSGNLCCKVPENISIVSFGKKLNRGLKCGSVSSNVTLHLKTLEILKNKLLSHSRTKYTPSLKCQMIMPFFASYSLSKENCKSPVPMSWALHPSTCTDSWIHVSILLEPARLFWIYLVLLKRLYFQYRQCTNCTRVFYYVIQKMELQILESWNFGLTDYPHQRTVELFSLAVLASKVVFNSIDDTLFLPSYSASA